MIEPNAVEGYRRMLARIGRHVTFRRVTGQAPNTVTTDVKVRSVFRNYTPSTPLGGTARSYSITEGLREFIVLASDLRSGGFPLPLEKNDKLIVEDETFNIVEVDDGTRHIAGAIEGRAVNV